MSEEARAGTAAGSVLIHLSLAGPVYSIDVGKRTYRFEWHRYFGPTVVDRHDEALAKQPAEKSRFWDAVSAWDRQGQRVSPYGKCIWETDRAE